MSFPFGMFDNIVECDIIPKDELWLVAFNQDGSVRKATSNDPNDRVFIAKPIRVHKIVNIGKDEN